MQRHVCYRLGETSGVCAECEVIRSRGQVRRGKAIKGDVKMYDYKTERARIFTEEGQRMFLAIRDRTHKLIDSAGAVSMGSAIIGQVGDSWAMLACVDRLVELGEIREITPPGVAGQDRVFVSTK